MAKKVGYEVTGTKPVCVDFPDGRSVSFTPGMRFEAHPTNSSVRRLLRVREVRVLSAREPVPALPEKLGAPKRVRDILESRSKMARAKKVAEAKAMRAMRTKKTKKSSSKSKPEFVDLAALNKPRRSKSDASRDEN